MISPNLVVTFTVAGDSRVHIKGASRIKVDGRGGLTLYDAEDRESELVNLGCLQSLTIRTVPRPTARPVSTIH
jgi:hypothetical protein